MLRMSQIYKGIVEYMTRGAEEIAVKAVWQSEQHVRRI